VFHASLRLDRARKSPSCFTSRVRTRSCACCSYSGGRSLATQHATQFLLRSLARASSSGHFNPSTRGDAPVRARARSFRRQDLCPIYAPCKIKLTNIRQDFLPLESDLSHLIRIGQIDASRDQPGIGSLASPCRLSCRCITVPRGGRRRGVSESLQQPVVISRARVKPFYGILIQRIGVASLLRYQPRRYPPSYNSHGRWSRCLFARSLATRR